MKKYDCIICGYYGAGNVGDDTVLSVLLKGIFEKNKYARVAVIADNPKSAEEKYGVECVGKKNIFGIILKMINSPLLIFGGGTLLQSRTSKKSLFYYTLIIFLGKKLCKNTVGYANGIENPSKGAIKTALKYTDFLSVRDSMSYREAIRGGFPRERLRISADPVFLAAGERSGVLEKYSLLPKGYFTVSLRSTKKAVPLGEIISFCRKCAADGYKPVFVPMQMSADYEICRRCAEKCGGTVTEETEFSAIAELISASAFSVGMRLHFLLISTIAEIPVIPLSYDVKIDAQLSYVKGEKPLSAYSFTAFQLLERLEKTRKSDLQAKANRFEVYKLLAISDIEFVKTFIKPYGLYRTLEKTLYSKSE